MADGKLVKALIVTSVNQSLNFQLIAGSYVYKGKKVDIVPSTGSEALATSLVGFFEKRCLQKFITFAYEFLEAPKDAKYEYVYSMTAYEIMKKFKLEPDTMTFVGHATALEPDDSYLQRPALELLKKLGLYYDSISKFKDQRSPYLYPMYGLGDLPQAFARLCAVWGGTYMLNTPVSGMLVENGRVKGIISGDNKAYAPIVIGDPSYFTDIPNKTRVKGKIVRAICLVNHPISCFKKPVDSANIIIPQSEVGRQHDIYVCFTSFQQRVCPNGWYIALVSTTVETDNPEEELKVGLDLLGKVEYKAVRTYDILEPVIPGKDDGMFCSASYDPTTHFETTIEEVLRLYEEIMGRPVDLENPPQPPAAN
jgi:Rab GDP dissociation inhibitor